MESRKWLNLLPLSNGSLKSTQFTVLSFNLLAQVLIQRQQFPHCTSQMLRWKQRSKRVLKELKLTAADILLVQEVDSFEEFYQKEFEQLGYHTIYNSGTGKKHGCCIAFKSDKFDLISQYKVDFDDYPISKNTYSTNNILQLVKVQFKESELGLILTNNHLFWHPNYDYERTRQFSILMEATKEFAKDCDFPVINGGDFNTTPSSLGYLTVTRILQDNEENKLKLYNEINTDLKNEIESLKEKIEACRDDLNALIALNESESTEASKEGAIKKLEDEIQAKEFNITQLENPDLLSIEEIVKIIESNESLKSAYSNYTKLDPSYLEPKYGYEPIYTNITPFFKGTLDYLFYRNSPKQKIEVESIFSLPDRENFGEGLPNLEYGSDHLSIAAKFNFIQ